MARINPSGVVHPVWYGPKHGYPDAVQVGMDNGHVEIYDHHGKRTEAVMKELLDRFTATCYGGEKYKTKGIGKRTGRRLDSDG